MNAFQNFLRLKTEKVVNVTFVKEAILHGLLFLLQTLNDWQFR